MKKVIILFGKPSAGKGTRLKKFLEGREDILTEISVSGLLKKEIKEQTDLGKKAATYMDCGQLVPDELVSEMVIEEIMKNEGTVAVDGFPRTVGQANYLLESELCQEQIKVINLMAEDETILQRARDRIVCEECGEPYTTNEFKKPKIEGICDKCGGKLVKRNDDLKEEIVRKRLEVFQKETYPVLPVLQDEGIHIVNINNNNVNAEKEFEAVMKTFL